MITFWEKIKSLIGEKGWDYDKIRKTLDGNERILHRKG